MVRFENKDESVDEELLNLIKRLEFDDRGTSFQELKQKFVEELEGSLIVRLDNLKRAGEIYECDLAKYKAID